MSKVGQKERATQNRIVELFQQQLQYAYYGDWQERPNNSSIEETDLSAWLRKQGHDDSLITNAIRKLKQAAAPDGRP